MSSETLKFIILERLFNLTLLFVGIACTENKRRIKGENLNYSPLKLLKELFSICEECFSSNNTDRYDPTRYNWFS